MTTLNKETQRPHTDDGGGFWGSNSSVGRDMTPLREELPSDETPPVDDVLSGDESVDETLPSNDALLDDDMREPEHAGIVEYAQPVESLDAGASWLSLSRQVDSHAPRFRPDPKSQASSRTYPMARGGRVVVRGPVEDLPIDEFDERADSAYLDDEYRDTLSSGSEEDTFERSYDSVAGATGQSSMRMSDAGFGVVQNDIDIDFDLELDEPPVLDDEVPEIQDMYLPPDVYVEENPYDLAMSEDVSEEVSEAKTSGTSPFAGSGQVWLDVEYEVLEERPTRASSRAREAEPQLAEEHPDASSDLIETGDERHEEEALIAQDEPVEFSEPDYLEDELLEDELLEDDEPEGDVHEDDKPAEESEEEYAGDVSPIDRIKRTSRRTRIIAACVIVAIILLIVYGVGVTRVSGKFLPRTTIGECDLSGLTQEQAEQALTDCTRNYMLTITVEDFSTGIMGESVSLDRDEARIAREAYESQSPFAWPIAMLFGTVPNVDQAITYDNVKFDKQVTDAVEAYNKEHLPATNVHVAYDEVAQTYSLEGSVEGKALDTEAILSVAHDRIATMHSSASPQPAVAMRQAEVDDLPQYASAVNNANTVRDATIPILVEGKQVAICDPLLIRSWVTVSDEPAVVVDTDALRSWSEKTLSPLVYKDGEWGEVFLDINVFVNEFVQRLKNGEPGPFEAVTYDELNREGTSRQQAYEESPWNKQLGRYIDVDLSAQFARLFDSSGNVIWESAFVSGDMYEGHQTITGTYELYAHLPGQVLVGLDYNNDGQPDYESYVNFWMPFYGGYGLHDATWRDSFGGDLYVYNGSHGCINLPYEKAEELYNMTSVGDTVYVHE